MDYVNIGRHKVSVVGLGTHLIGGKIDADFSMDEKYIEIIKEAIYLGINHIDTSEVYGAGHCEEVIGKAISGFDRSKLFIASKVWGDNLSRNDLIKSLKSSLLRLDSDYIDLYYIHNQNPNIPLKDTMHALEEVKDIGLIKNIGVSNFSLDLIKEANSYLSNCKIAAVQIEYNLLKKDYCKEVLKFCQEQNIIFVAYKPLAKGSLINGNNSLLDDLVKKYNKSKAQIAINWLVNQKNVITIPKASSLEHLSDNVNSCGWKLEQEDYDLLSKNSF